MFGIKKRFEFVILARPTDMHVSRGIVLIIIILREWARLVLFIYYIHA